MRKNRRTVALLIYALLLNLVGQALALAHRAEARPGTWCSSATMQPAQGLDGSTPLAPSASHDECAWACAMTSAAVTPAGDAADPPTLLHPLATPLHGTSPDVRLDRAWFARGPPVV